MSVQAYEPIAAAESERPALNKIEGVLENVHRVPKLVGPDGEEIELPRSVFHILRQVVYHLAHGRAVTVMPLNKELTTQEAADLLNVSRPYLVKLLEEGKLPYIKVGTHRRIRFDDLMEYKKRRHEAQIRAINEIAQISQEAGLYD